jgi:hypothetical protein
MTVDGLPVPWPVGTHKVLGALRWTPDGNYVSFPEADPHPIPIIGAYYRLIVCRVRDGRTIRARKFGGGVVDVGAFYWIVDYRKFCGTCKAGAGYN